MILTQKLLFLAICTLNGLLCGTLYLYSAYGPQLALRLGYSGSQASLMAFAGTIGISLTGVPVSMLIEHKGFTVAVLMGALAIGTGYLGLKSQYDHTAPDLWLSVFFVYLAGMGSTSINLCLIKCSAVSFPASYRGMATSFPIASYGLSAFVFSSLGGLFYKGDISGFLGLLGWCCLSVPVLSLPVFYYADRLSQNGFSSSSTMGSASITPRPGSIELQGLDASSSLSRHKPLSEELMMRKLAEHEATLSHGPKSMMQSLIFWIFFWIAGVLVALGQMYIYSVGFMIKALLHYDGDLAIQKEQQFEVSLLSIFNCVGRLCCGFLGDLIANQFNRSRTWILFVPISCLLVVQMLGFMLHDEEYLWIMSSLNGFGYGFVWASVPQVIIELFGVSSLSFGWGFINLAPILPAYFLTHLFGSNYDGNLEEDGEGESKVFVCLKKSVCYVKTFQVSALVATVTFGLIVWLVAKQVVQNRRQKYNAV